MNKKNKILVGCLALLLALSVGYALFSDTITINGTATAKGSFDITATCEPGILSKLGTVETFGWNKEGGYQKDTCSVVDDNVSVSVDFLYPGARRNFTIKITNTGTIDAFYDRSKLVVSEELCVANNLEGNNLKCTQQADSIGHAVVSGYAANGYFEYGGLEDEKGNLLSQSELLEYFDPSTGNVILKPGYSAYILFGMFIEHEKTPDNYLGITPPGEMFVEYNTTFTLPLEQHMAQ